MKSLLVQLDEPTLEALERVAPAAQRHRTEFIRTAIRTAIREIEEEKTRLAYLAKPDHAAEAADWSGAEPWRPKDPTKWAAFAKKPASARARSSKPVKR
ncbi:MAG: hypothetical protein ABI824_05935 [Acidobacteriota bacterium]